MSVCFTCGGKLAPVYKDETEPEGTWFFASGNYGSGVFDPAHDGIKLRIVVCDTCLVTHKDRVQTVNIRQTPTEYTYAPWEPGAEDE